ncbi:MAG: RsmB/NOP family class I SAM-dependent RNA methyltransferase [Verrucomicrobia bacterium]|nr:RsmB/NOP family class I SAM-dependent RNA methyltransferase [Verrucomicrobiota bacterium]
MEKTFRDYHLFQILNSTDFGSVPLDVHLGHYFRNHRALGSKDRKFIAERIYKLVRWMGLIDYFCSGNHSWDARNTAFEKIDLPHKIKDPSIPSHIRASFPKHFFNLLVESYGEEEAFKICLNCNATAPTTIRINPLKTTRSMLLTQLEKRFSIGPTPYSDFGIHFVDKVNFNELPEFKEGLFDVQDEGSQLVANLVEANPGDQVLDYCAGAGGKTLAFAFKLQGKGQIYLHDIRDRPLQEAKKRLKRAGIENGQILTFDSPQKRDLLGKMDWVLVDVPCSGSGTLRRNPDLKWKFSPEMLSRLVEEQREIFTKALEYMAPNGKIVYATCSILPHENEQQIAFFTETYGLELVKPPFKSLPENGGMDGFFGAILTCKQL